MNHDMICKISRENLIREITNQTYVICPVSDNDDKTAAEILTLPKLFSVSKRPKTSALSLKRMMVERERDGRNEVTTDVNMTL